MSNERTVAESRTIVIAPEEAREPLCIPPFDLDEPAEFGALVFFREREVRARFLTELKRAAGQPQIPADDIAAFSGRLAMEYDLALRRNCDTEALIKAVTWWTRVRRETYHVYQLSAEAGPYRTSCLVALGPVELAGIARGIAFGTSRINEARQRMMDFFGFAGNEADD